MRKFTATTITACLIATSASANSFFDPPERYRGKPDMPVNVIRLSLSDLRKYCRIKVPFFAVIYGCARVLPGPPRRCVVMIPNSPVLNTGWPIGLTPIITPEMVLRHEMGHCNGWPANHPQ